MLKIRQMVGSSATCRTRVTRAFESIVHDNHARLMRFARRVLGLFSKAIGLNWSHFGVLASSVSIKVIRRTDPETGEPLAEPLIEYVPAYNVVTTAGLQAIVDAMQGSFAIENFKYHAVGTDATAAGAGNTDLGVQVESRSLGTQAENGTTTYRTVATINITASRALVEAGLFSASTLGTMLARVTFPVINLSNGDSIETTWDVQVSAA